MFGNASCKDTRPASPTTGTWSYRANGRGINWAIVRIAWRNCGNSSLRYVIHQNGGGRHALRLRPGSGDCERNVRKAKRKNGEGRRRVSDLLSRVAPQHAQAKQVSASGGMEPDRPSAPRLGRQGTGKFWCGKLVLVFKTPLHRDKPGGNKRLPK